MTATDNGTASYRQRMAQQIAQVCAWPVARWEQVLFWIFFASIVLFPLGQAFRVAPPLVALPVLVLLYVKDWPGRNLRHLPVWWLLLILFAAVGLELAGSLWLDTSWKAVRPNLLRGFALPFIAMECVRGERDLRRLVGAFALVSIVEGLNGVWQFATGADLITQTAPMRNGNVPADVMFTSDLASLRTFRLTGAMSTYRVGNYMALIGLPACAIFLLWPVRRAVWRVLLTICLLSPAIFLWIGAQARAGFLAVVAGLYMLWLMLARPRWYLACLPVLGGVAVLLAGPSRVSLATVMQDERWAIWNVAWQCIVEHPWFGSGADTFARASEALGVTLLSTGNAVPIHPHNMYIQWLVDGGVVGFTLKMIFALGIAAWAGWQIWQGLYGRSTKPQPDMPGTPSRRQFWGLTTFFWAAWIGYLANGLGAHGFYRTWWVSTAFGLLGVLLGACVTGRRLDRQG